MKIQPMAHALRVTLSVKEARALRDLARRGDEAMGFMSPDAASDIIAMLDCGIFDVQRKQAEAKARKKALLAKPTQPLMRNLTIDGFTICAIQGDWADVSPDPDSECWVSVTDERLADQREVRRQAWRVMVLNPDHYGDLHLAAGCTDGSYEEQIEPLARKLVATLPALAAA